MDADETVKNRIANEWGEKTARHMHLDDGFSIVAIRAEQLVGLISVYWKILPPPLPETCEGYIDILEVHQDFRRRGDCYKIDRNIDSTCQGERCLSGPFLEFFG
jgi:hypothetical protein